MSYLTSIAPVVMGNKLLYILNHCIITCCLAQRVLYKLKLKLASPSGIDSIIQRLPTVMSEDLHTHTIKWKCESGRCDGISIICSSHSHNVHASNIHL